MEKYYDTDGMHVYLVLKETEYCATYETKMLQSNELIHVLPFSVMIIDGDAIPSYNVSGMTELGLLAEKNRITATFVLQLFEDLCIAVDQLKKFLLSVNDLILIKDYVFYDTANKWFNFVYLPGYQNNIRIQINALLDDLISKMDHSDRANSALVYDIYQKIVNENCDIGELASFLHNKSENRVISSGAIEQQMDAAAETLRKNDNSEGVDRISKEEHMPERKDILRSRLYKMISIGSMIGTFLFGAGYVIQQYRTNGCVEQIRPLFGVCVLLAVELFLFLELDRQKEIDEKTTQNVTINMEKQETSVLSAENMSYMLIPVYGQQVQIYPTICLDEIPKLIGRGKKADVQIPERSVSKVHSRIYFVNYEYMLEDMDSTNGTYVNGYQLQTKYPVILTPGDIVSFGCVQYEFCVQ